MNLARLQQQWLPVCTDKEVTQKPQRFLLLGMPLVIYRVNEAIVVLQDKCPHRGAPLSAGQVKDGVLQCPYHGWRFNTHGQCINIPGLVKETTLADKVTPAYSSRVHLGLVFVCMQENETTLPLYDIPALANDNYRAHYMRLAIEGELLNIVENTLDATHTHFIHAKLLRQDSKRQAVSAHLKVTPHSAQVSYAGEAKQTGLVNALFEKSRQSSIGRFQFPLIAELEYYHPKGLTAAFSFFLSPITETTHRVFVFISYPQTGFISWLKKTVLLPFIRMALKQDLAILQKQANNLALFPETRFKSTELDLIRPHVERIFAGEAVDYEKQIKMML